MRKKRININEKQPSKCDKTIYAIYYQQFIIMYLTLYLKEP